MIVLCVGEINCKIVCHMVQCKAEYQLECMCSKFIINIAMLLMMLIVTFLAGKGLLIGHICMISMVKSALLKQCGHVWSNLY